MAGIHDKFARLAEKLIAKHGRDMDVKKLSREPADASKPWRAGGPPPPGGPTWAESLTVKGVVVDYDEDDIDGTNIKRGDKRVLIAADTAVTAGKDIADFDTVLDQGRPLSIIKCNVLEPGTTRIMYDVQCRQ